MGKRFRMSELPGLNELEAFVNEISPAVRSKLAWQINRSLGLDTNAIRPLLKDKSIEEEWLQFELESELTRELPDADPGPSSDFDSSDPGFGA